MKTIKTWLTTIAVLLCSTAVNAYDFEVDGIYYNIISASDFTAEVTKGDNKYSGDIVIPETVVYKSKVLTITRIVTNAFNGCSGLASVDIPNSVIEVDDNAFYGCSGLTSVIIGNGVASIGESAFYGCSSLTNIDIPNSVTEIDDKTFEDCSGLTSVIIGNGVASIGERAFYGCSGLTSITIGNSVASIGYSAFENCSGLTSVTIGNSVTSIGNHAFNGCSGLKELRIEDGTKSLWLGNNDYDEFYGGKGLFYDCPLEILYLGRNLSYNAGRNYGYSPFEVRKTLTTLTIGNSVTYIRDHAFYGCSGLKELRIEDGTETLSLGYNDYCEGLFYGCPLEILYLGRNLSYKTDSDYGYSPFYYKRTLTSVTIGNSVTSIGSYAFGNCYRLISIEIPNSVTSIGSSAFYDCSGLTSIEISNSVTSIGSSAFYGCSGLTSIYLLGKTPPSVDSGSFTEAQYVGATLYVPQGSLAAYQSADIWKEFWDIQETDTPEKPNTEVQTCGAPTISYNNCGLDISCDTDGAEVHTTITCSDASSYNSNRIDFSATYLVTSYATKPGWKNSESVTATLCWLAVSGKPGNEIIEVEAIPLLITCKDGEITISCDNEGAKVTVYNTNGVVIGSSTITSGNATIHTDLAKGEIAIVNIADKNIKVVMQ